MTTQSRCRLPVPGSRSFRQLATGNRQLLLAVLLCIASISLHAQVTNLGPAGQYYKTAPPKKGRFSFVKPPQKGDQIELLHAKSQSIEKDEFAVFEGDVKFKYGDVTLAGDKFTYNFRTKDVTGEGHVILDQGATRLSGSQMVFNLGSSTGTFFNATGSMEPAMYFTGEKLEKLTEDTYRLTNGVITSCDLDSPSWSINVARADVTVDDYARMQDATFRIHRFPLIWLPRLIWPTKGDRSQGFLIPRVSFSSCNPASAHCFGNRFEIGYFIPFGQTADTTLYGDLSSTGYNAFGVDFRYRPSSDIKLGELNGYVVNDALDHKKQWRYAYQHSQENLPGGFRGVVDLEDFSDLDFFRNYDRDPRVHTLSQIYSSAYLTKNWSTYSLNLLADRRDIILGHTDPADLASPLLKQRFEQLPSLQFRVFPMRLFGSPIYFSMESSTSHLVTNGSLNGPSADYFRGDVFPTVSMQIPSPPWFSIKPQISARETYYSASAITDPTTFKTTTVDDTLNRGYVQGQVEFVGPSFSKIFNRSIGNFTRFKHVIEPRFTYVYTSDVTDVQQRIIRFDTVDTPFLPVVPNSVQYSLTQRLIGKEKSGGSAREVLSFSLRQSVSLSKPFTNSTGGSLPGTTVPPGQNNKFTPLIASLHINPYQSLTFDANATFGNVSHQLDQTSISANIMGTGKQADKYLTFSWFSTFRQPVQTTTPDITQTTTGSSQIRLNTGTSLLHDRLRGDVQLSYDASQGTFIDERYLIGMTAACYGLAIEYRRYLVYDPLPKPRNTFGFAVTLKNVGTIGTH
jgi:lipopolysaccharide assembly outer membrane protein LptD (OstA)